MINHSLKLLMAKERIILWMAFQEEKQLKSCVKNVDLDRSLVFKYLLNGWGNPSIFLFQNIIN